MCSARLVKTGSLFRYTSKLASVQLKSSEGRAKSLA
jgi:hypothetical protein